MTYLPEMTSDEIAAACDSLLARDTQPTVPEVRPLTRAFYELHPTGGSLHIVLDDGNVKDSDVQSCVDYAIQGGDKTGEKLGRVLLLMSPTQRNKL